MNKKATPKSKPTPKEIDATRRINAAWETARLRRRTLAKFESDTLCFPGPLSPTIWQDAREQQRKALLGKHKSAASWIDKLIKKIDLSTFRDLATGEEHLTEGRRLGRTIAHTKAMLAAADYEKNWRGLFGKRIAEKLAEKAMTLDAQFFKDFADALPAKAVNADNSTALAIYYFLLRHRAGVEKCKRVCDIEKLPGFPKYDKSSFCRICRELGLPLKS